MIFCDKDYAILLFLFRGLGNFTLSCFTFSHNIPIVLQKFELTMKKISEVVLTF